MTDIPLKLLGLEKKWAKLATLQDDLATFQRRHQKASAEASALQARIPQARGEDLDREAAAIRRGQQPPKPTAEPAAQRDLDRAVRERDVAARVVQRLHEELGGYLAEHQAQLYEDVVEARAEVARELAKHARAALQHFARHEDLGRIVKQLRPAAPADETRPAAAVTNSFVGLVTTKSIGPPRGEIEGALSYLVGLGDDGTEGEASGAA